MFSNISSALCFYEDSLAIFRRTGNLEKTIKVINEIASTYRFTGEFEKASEFIQESFTVAEKENNEIGMAYALKIKALLFMEEGEYEKALNVAEEFLLLSEKLESLHLINSASFIKGRALLCLERYYESYKCFENNLSSGEKTGDKFVISQAYRGLSRVFYEKGDMAKALDFIKESIEISLSIENKLGNVMGEYAMAHILKEKGEIYEAIDLYSRVMKKGEELSFKKLEIGAAIEIIKNRLKFKELTPSLEEILKLKKKIPEYLIREMIEINLILADIYIRKYKQKKKDFLLDEAFKLSEKSRDVYGLSKTCYMISKMSDKSKEEREVMKKRSEEYFKKLIMSEKRELKDFFEEMDKKAENRYIVKTADGEMIIDDFELAELRNKKENYEIFIDIPEKYAFEKEKGEIYLFRKVKLLSLLLFFINNMGKEFSLEEIHKEIWEWEYEGEISDIGVRKGISRLRKLLEPDKEIVKYILHREDSGGQKGKYYFNYETNFCLITDLYER